MVTPDICHSIVKEGCGFNPRDDSSQIYTLSDESDLCLIGTSEAPIAGMFSNEILKESSLPLKYVAYSHCFRKEAGKGGMSKGIYRLHQFAKVEMFAFTKAEDSESTQMELLEIQKELYDEIGLHYKVLDMASAELGSSAYRKYDLEAWFPARNAFGEITSVSNCTNYQSKRLNITYLGPNNVKMFPHTINGTAVAVPRLIMAILENFQTKEGNVIIPEALRPYMGGITEINTPRTSPII